MPNTLPIIIEDATDSHMPTVCEIYAHHVRTGGGSFEYDPPDLDEIVRRRDAVRDAGYPYIVAIQGKQVLGYAYAARYRPREAYRYSVEDSVYVAKDATGLGIGGMLLGTLIERCTAAGFRQMIAVIGDSENHGSIALHRKMGFRQVGIIEKIGFKFGKWLDSVTMQLPLGPGGTSPPDK